MRRQLLAMLMLALPVAGAAAPADPPDPAKAEAELKAVTRQLNDLDTWFGDADRKKTRLQQALEASDRDVASMTVAVDQATAAVDAAEAALAQLDRDTAGLRREQAEQARQIANHLSAARRLEGEDFFKLILNQESPEAFDRMIRYHRYFSEARIASLEAYRSTLEQVAANEQRLRAAVADAGKLREDRESRRAALVAERDERKTLIAELDAQAQDKTAERERLSKDSERLGALLAELQRKALKLDGRSFAQSRGRLPWPVDGRVLHAFGKPRAEGRMTWDGILIATAEGTPFRAVQRGRIVFADWLRGFGLMAIVDHGSGFLTLYGQADALTGKVGDRVEAGDVIGRTGRSGGRKEAGLYFEIRQNGAARDPAAWLGKR